jgi:hypothetical protein
MNFHPITNDVHLQFIAGNVGHEQSSSGLPAMSFTGSFK